jgi:L-asparaginase
MTEPGNSRVSRILLIYTGGTIGMKESSAGLFPVSLDDLLEQLPDIGFLPVELTLVSLDRPMDSSDLRPEHWVQIGEMIQRNSGEMDAFLVLHGTDTMAYTAAALSFMLQQLGKPVIFTGSQLPLGHPRSDAASHWMSALEIALAKSPDGMPRVPEIALYFNHALYRGNRVRKLHALGFDAFDSPNYPVLARAGTHIEYAEDAIGHGMPSRFGNQGQNGWFPEMDTGILSLKLFPGLRSDFWEQALHTPSAKAVLIEAYGAGNIPADFAMMDLLKAFVQRGGHLIALSQCVGGQVDLTRYQSGRRLLDLGAVSGMDMTYEAALTKAMHLLGTGSQDFRGAFGQSIAGEMGSFG